MKKNLFIVLIIILGALLIVGGLCLLRDTTKSNSNSSNNSNSNSNTNSSSTNANVNSTQNTVLYVQDNFLPQVLQVKVGATIHFINQSDSDLQVVSDPHPAHSILPDFNAQRAYEKGEVYSYTFIRPGTFPYHNESNTAKTGLIVVE